MANRERAPFGTVTFLTVLTFGSLTDAQVSIEPSAVPAEETVASVTDPAWRAPRTSWGHPSLEGVYSTDDMRSVPRERPETMGTREKLTPEEFTQRAQADADDRDQVLNQSSYSARSVGSRTFGWTSQLINPPNGRLPPMTEAALARAGPWDRGTFGPGPFDSFDDFTSYDRCLSRGVLGSAFNVVYGNGLRIAQTPDAVVISYEMLTDSRVIHLDGRPHPQATIRQWMGSSRGRWEGDTLVVETRNLNGRNGLGGNGNGTRFSTSLTLIERLTRVDPQMIEYVVTVDDLVAYTAPFTFRMMWTTQPGYEIFEYSCHEGNRAVAGALGGERNYEQRVREALAKGEPAPERLPSSANLGRLPEDEAVFLNINRNEHAN
jgi:hypothetical protein